MWGWQHTTSLDSACFVDYSLPFPRLRAVAVSAWWQKEQKYARLAGQRREDKKTGHYSAQRSHSFGMYHVARFETFVNPRSREH